MASILSQDLEFQWGSWLKTGTQCITKCSGPSLASWSLFPWAAAQILFFLRARGSIIDRTIWTSFQGKSKARVKAKNPAIMLIVSSENWPNLCLPWAKSVKENSTCTLTVSSLIATFLWEGILWLWVIGGSTVGYPGVTSLFHGVMKGIWDIRRWSWDCSEESWIFSGSEEAGETGFHPWKLGNVKRGSSKMSRVLCDSAGFRWQEPDR